MRMTHTLPISQDFHGNAHFLHPLNVPTCRQGPCSPPLPAPLVSLSHPLSPAQSLILFLNILFLVPVSPKCPCLLGHFLQQTCCGISHLKTNIRKLELTQTPPEWQIHSSAPFYSKASPESCPESLSVSSPPMYHPNRAFILRIPSKQLLWMSPNKLPSYWASRWVLNSGNLPAAWGQLTPLLPERLSHATPALVSFPSHRSPLVSLIFGSSSSRALSGGVPRAWPHFSRSLMTPLSSQDFKYLHPYMLMTPVLDRGAARN